MDILLTLGNRIRDSRRALGISQGKFALMIGMNRDHMSEIECGKKDIKFSTLVKISEGLNIPLPELLSDFDKK